MADVRIEGMARFRSTLRKAGHDLSDLKAANQRASAIVAQWASVTAPRRSGMLGSSVRPTTRVSGARVLGGSASVPYAGPIHWGWPARHIGAQPFMSRAAQSTESIWRGFYEQDLRDIIGQIQGV
jgi:hypothetical protein